MKPVYTADDDIALSGEVRLSLRYRYHHLLREEGKRLYRFLVMCALEKQYHLFYVKAWEPSVRPAEAQSAPVLEYGAHDMADVAFVYDCLLWDFPELYYLLQSGPAIYPDGRITMESVFPALNYTSEEITRLDRKLERLYHTFDAIPTGYPLERAVYDHIITHYDYAHDVDTYRGKKHLECFTVAGLLRRGEAVCAGITRLAQYLLMRRGMLVTPLSFHAAGDDERSHCWLAVKLNGRFYHLDITHGESWSRELWAPQFTTFNITDRELLSLSPRYCPEAFPGIVCTAWRDNYYHREGLYFRTPEEVTAGFTRFIEAHRDAIGNIYYYFRTSPRLSIARTARALSSALRGVKHEHCAYLQDRHYFAVELCF